MLRRRQLALYRRILAFVAIGLATQLDPAVTHATTSPPPHWVLYSYNQSGTALVPGATAPLPGTLAAFPFPTTKWAALLVTGGLAGNYTGRTLAAGVGITATPGAILRYLGQPDPCGAPATVRLYFGTQTYSPAIVTAFNEANFWWSRAGVAALESLRSHDSAISSPFDPALWSDALGHFGSESATYARRFTYAVQHVRFIGLSFGGGCYFDNGIQLVPRSGSASFRLTSFTG